MSPKMKTALTDIAAAGTEGAYRRNWHGATVAALLRSGAIETVPGATDMVRVPVVASQQEDARINAREAALEADNARLAEGLDAATATTEAAETGTYEDAACEGCGREIHRWHEYGSSLRGPWTHGKGRHRQTGCAGLYTYARPVKDAPTDPSRRPWDEEIISGTEALLSVLTGLTPDDLSMIDDARDLDERKSERDQATALIGKRVRIMGDRTANPATALVIGTHETTHGDQYVDLDFGGGWTDASLASHVIVVESVWVAKGTKRKINKGRKLAQGKGR